MSETNKQVMEALEAFLGDERSIRSEDLTPMPEPAKVAETLRAMYQAYHLDMNIFSPGDLIFPRFPDNAGINHRGYPCIFLEYLEEPLSAMDLEDVNLDAPDISNKYDCRIAILAEGQTYMEFLSRSMTFEAYNA